MPTGYTAGVGDGKVTDFRTFALRCGRAFGATIMQRDSSIDVLPQRRKESTFYAEHVAEGEAEIDRLAGLSKDGAQQEMAAEAAEVKETNERWHKDRKEKQERYDTMLLEVRRWFAPTPDHAELKKFMVQQLTESIDHDCSEFSLPTLDAISLDDWFAEKQVRAAEQLERDRTSLKKEQERVATANAWIDALYESLEAKP